MTILGHLQNKKDEFNWIHSKRQTIPKQSFEQNQLWMIGIE